MLENLKEEWNKFFSNLSSKKISLSGKLAEKLGFKERIDQDSSTELLLDENYDRYSFQDLLHYDVYDPDSKIYLNKESMGWGLQVTSSTGSSEEFIQILSSILTDVLPAEGDLQVLLWASPKVGPAIDAVENTCSKLGGEFQALAKKQSDYLKQGAFNSLSRFSDFILRDHQVYFFFSLSKNHADANIAALIQYREDTISSLRSINLGSEPLEIEPFLSFLNDLLSPNENIYPALQNWNKHEPLTSQITDTEQLIQVKPNKILFTKENSEWEARCFSVKNFPKVMAQWKMNDNLGKLFNSALQIPCPYLISLNIHLDDPEKSHAKVQAKIITQDSKVNSQLTKWLPSLSREHQDWKMIRERLSEGDKLVSLFYQVILFSPNKEMSRAERKLRDLYQSNGWKLRCESYLQLQSFLSALPMMMSEGLYKDLKRFKRLRRMTAFNAVNIMPLQGEWKGCRSPLMMLPGRRGQITWWDPFSNEGNYNVSIAAKSRSGKSVFVQAYITALIGSGGRCWVIDIGHSYEKTCRLLGGEFVEFSMQTPLCINPFSGIKNFSEALPMLIPLLGSMARPKTVTSEEEDAYLEEAIVAVWSQHAHRATITLIRDYLKEKSDPIARNLSHLLVSYSKDGMYAMFFEGISNINMDNSFIVFELLGLKDKQELQRIVLLTLMSHVHHSMYLTGRSQRKSCIIDEAWSLFGKDSGGAAKFIETGYRTSARHNGNFISITQGINDYYQSASSIAAFQNSDIKVILAQTSEAIQLAKDKEQLHMDPFLEKLLSDIKKVEGAYSECVISSPNGYSIHRIVLNPYTRILFSSKGPEVDDVKSLEAQGISLREAVDYVARKHFPEHYHD